MPETLLEFTITIVSVIVEGVVAIFADIVLAISTVGQRSGGGLLSHINTSAIFEPVYLQLVPATHTMPWFSSDIASNNVLEIPITIIPLVFMVYIAGTSIRALISLIQGGSLEGYEKIYRAGIVVMVIVLAFGIGYNMFISTVVESRASEYDQNIQWAIPTHVSNVMPNPPVYYLTRMVLRSNLKKSSSLGVKMQSIDVSVISGIAGLTYLLSMLSAGGADQTTVIIFVLIQFVGRNLVLIFLLIGSVMPYFKENKIIGEVVRYIGSLVIVSVIIVPFAASVTNGVIFSLPTMLAKFHVAQASRTTLVVNSVMDKNAYIKSDVCAGLGYGNISECDFLPEHASDDVTDADITILIDGFVNILQETFIAAVALVVINSLQLAMLKGALIMGYAMTGVAVSAYSSVATGSSFNFSGVASTEYNRAIEQGGAVGRAMEQVLAPIRQGLQNLVASSSRQEAAARQNEKANILSAQLTQKKNAEETEQTRAIVEGMERLSQRDQVSREGTTEATTTKNIVCSYCGAVNPPSVTHCLQCQAPLQNAAEVADE